MRQNAKEKGSLTVEAILVLPLCMMVIVGLMTCFPLLRLQLQLQSVLVQTVQMQAVYAGTQEEGDASWLGAEGELLALCQKEQVDLDQVTAGMLGLHLFLDTEGNEVLHAILTYQFQPDVVSGMERFMWRILTQNIWCITQNMVRSIIRIWIALI